MYLVPSMPTQSRVASGNLNRYFSPPKRKRKKAVSHPSEDRQKAAHRKLTTSFLTATALVYTLGAGITAAAGTRLALQLLLIHIFTLYSFQSSTQRAAIGICRHYLAVSAPSNLRACCLPWKW